MKKELITTNLYAVECFDSTTAEDNIIADKICAAFGSGKKNVIVSAKTSLRNTKSVLEYAKGSACSCEKVIYCRFDREKYLCRDMSIDAVLKKCLVNHIVRDDVECECTNFLEEFENSLDENTLLIIDNYEINAPSPYMRHLFALDCKVVIITSCDMQNSGCDVVRVDVDDAFEISDFSVLDDEGKELLMTVCAMLYYLEDELKIISSPKGVFDEESLRFYVGDLSDKLCVLLEYGFVERTLSGRIFVERNVLERVMTQLCPSAENCKRFMTFISETLDFDIMQCSKDFKGRLSVCDKEDVPLSAFDEILRVYTHFIKSDAECGKRLYNLLFSLMLDRLAVPDASHCNSHLLVRNAAYYLRTLSKCLEDENLLSKIYSQRLYVYDTLPEFYTGKIRAKLDLVRLSCMFLRNVTCDLYDFSMFAFEMLYDCMEYLYENEIVHDDDVLKKLLLLDDVIRLCDELFSYSEVVDELGIYLAYRDNIKSHRISFTCEKNCDTLYAISCAFGHSVMTVKLYGMYQKYIDTWLNLEAENDKTPAGKLLLSFYKEKKQERINKSESITMLFNRARLGYENCIPECLPKEECFQKAYEYTFDADFEKRLSDNKRLLQRGFDGGTKSGGKRYSQVIVSAFRQSEEKIKLLSVILDYDYPLTDNTYESLLSCGFAEMVLVSDMVNFSKQMLLEMLVFRYRANSEKKNLSLLIENLIEGLLKTVNHNTASMSRLCDFTAHSYLCNKIGNYGNDDFVTSLYERICLAHEVNESICHEFLARVLYRKISGENFKASSEKICSAIDTYALVQKMCKSEIDEEKLEDLRQNLTLLTKTQYEGIIKV